MFALREAGLKIVESYLIGFSDRYAVPLCITQGELDLSRTPLSDQEFTADANPYAQEALYAAYLELGKGIEDQCEAPGGSTLPVYTTGLAAGDALKQWLSALQPGSNARPREIRWGDKEVFKEVNLERAGNHRSGAGQWMATAKKGGQVIAGWVVPDSDCQERRIAVQGIPYNGGVSEATPKALGLRTARVCNEHVTVDGCKVRIDNSEAIDVLGMDYKSVADISSWFGRSGDKICLQRTAANAKQGCSLSGPEAQRDASAGFVDGELIYEVISLGGIPAAVPYWECRFELTREVDGLPIIERRKNRVLAIKLGMPIDCL